MDPQSTSKIGAAEQFFYDFKQCLEAPVLVCVRTGHKSANNPGSSDMLVPEIDNLGELGSAVRDARWFVLCFSHRGDEVSMCNFKENYFGLNNILIMLHRGS